MSLQNEAVQNGQELASNESLKDGCCLLGWQLSSPCGESTLPNAKIELDGAQINSTLIKGSKIQWFPRNKLKLTTKFSNRITRTFNSYGVKYGDFTVVPTARLNELQIELDGIEQDWSEEVNDILQSYDETLEVHINDNSEIKSLIEKYALTAAEFKAKFKLRFTKPLAMQPLFAEDEDEISMDVTDTLWQEIAKEADSVYKQNWFKNGSPVSQISQKVRSPFKRMMSKLVNLSFLDEGIDIVLDTITEVLDNMPKTGYVKGHDFSQLTNWLLVMRSEEILKLHAQGESQYTAEKEITENVDVDTTEANNSAINPPASATISAPIVEQEQDRTSELTDFGFDW